MMWSLPTLERIRDLQRIAVLTSGGDSPGMNAAVRGVVRTAVMRGIEVLGVRRGYSGLLKQDWGRLDARAVANVLQRGGTLLKTDRCPAFLAPAARAQAAQQLRAAGIEALVVIGGDGSLAGAHWLAQETGMTVVGLPATIDNDIYGTDDTIGFDTAVNTALQAIDRIRDTAFSHERVFLVEVMGRNAGFIAVQVGLAGGAEQIILPGVPPEPDAICRKLRLSERRGKRSSLIVVAEGSELNLTGRLTQQLNQRGFSARACILGHIQRGGSPTGHDRVLASTLAACTLDYLQAGYTDVMLGVVQGAVTATPLDTVIHRCKVLEHRYQEMAEILAC